MTPIITKKRYLMPLLGILAVVAIAGLWQTSRAANHQVDPITDLNLDHFKCYTADGETVKDVAFLQDQFDVSDKRFERVKVEKPKIFCNPTRKIHGSRSYGVINANNHLTWYEIEPIFRERITQREVIVKNQFGEQTLTVRKPKFLLVPTQKLQVDGTEPPIGSGAPDEIDHFKCYEAVGRFRPVSVTLQDQFDLAQNRTEQVRVAEPKVFCNPVRKIHHDFEHDNNIGIQNAKAHLTCYNIKPKEPTPHELLIGNQFGKEQKLAVRRPEMLCVPSEKKEAVEQDRFSSSQGRLLLTDPAGQQHPLDLAGQSGFDVFFEGMRPGEAQDDDGDGLDEIPTEMVSMNLTGGGLTLMLRDPLLHPHMMSTGQMEEQANVTPGMLDVMPFAPQGNIDSFFDVFTEITLPDGMRLHNIQPLRIGGTFTHKPPAPGETYTGNQPVELYDEQGNPTGYRLEAMSYMPQ